MITSLNAKGIFDMKTAKLTTLLLNKIIKEEVAKFGAEEDVEKRAKDTEEVDADEIADSLEKNIDFIHALKIEETRLVARLEKIKEQRRNMLKKIAEKK